jgi:aminocarboxymuconate-semialdehyde decarboxylase
VKFCLSHGGGFVPYQAGRFVHGWNVRPEPKRTLSRSPEASVRCFYFDTILHAAAPLEFLVNDVGAARVLLGSDYPFDMGMRDCVRYVRSLAISEVDRAIILGEGARALLEAAVGTRRRASTAARDSSHQGSGY